MRKFITIILTLICFSTNAQGFRVRHYLPGALNNTAKAIFETSSGNYFTGGITFETINNLSANRLCIMGLVAQGQISWIKKYGSYKFEYLDNPFITSSYYKYNNNIYYAGCVRDSNDKYIGVLIKFNLNGDTLWQKIYRDAQEDVIPQMVTRSVDGGFLITGFFQNWTSNSSLVLLIKTDADGNELWRQKVSKVAPNTQDGKRILQDSASKKIVIVGYQYLGNSTSWSDYDNILVLDSLGFKLEQKHYVGAGLRGYLLDLIQTKDKKFVAVGTAIYPQTIGGNNLIMPYILKFDINNLNGPIWKINNFGKLSFVNNFRCLRELPNEDLLVGGLIDTLQVTNLPTNCLARFTTINKNGLVKKNRLYNYNTTPNDFYEEQIDFLSLTSDGGWVAAFSVFNFPSPNPFHFVKYDSLGCDTTLAYCQMMSSVGIAENKIYNSLTVDIYPNPTNGLLNISMQGATPGKEIILTVSDISGRLVKEITLEPDCAEQTINLGDLTNGTYELTLMSDKRAQYKGKIVKID